MFMFFYHQGDHGGPRGGFPFESNYWKNQRPPECLINHLMTIQMEWIYLTENLIEFVKFLLINANVLIKMRLVYGETLHNQGKEKTIVNDLLLFKRASPNVLLEIVSSKV